jgi:hypothetical protein
MILGVNYMRHEPLGGQSTLDQSLGRGVLEDHAMTGGAGQLGPAGYDHPVLHRNDVKPLALIAANLNEIAFAGRAAGCSRHQRFDDAWQMLRQLATIGPALGSSLLACFGIGAVLGCFESRNGLIDIIQNKLELISVKLFRRSTELRIFRKLEQPLELGAAIQQSRGKDTQLGWLSFMKSRNSMHRRRFLWAAVTLPVATSKAANSVDVPLRLQSWLWPRHFQIALRPLQRSSAWIEGFSSTQMTIAFSGGAM